MLQHKYNQTKQLEARWFSTIQNMPNGVLLQNVQSGDIILQNKMIQEILTPNDDLL